MLIDNPGDDFVTEIPVDPKFDEDCMAGLNLSNTKLKEMEFRQE